MFLVYLVGGRSLRGSCVHFDQPDFSLSLSRQIRWVWFCRIFTRMAFYLDFFSRMKGGPVRKTEKGAGEIQGGFQAHPI